MYFEEPGWPLIDDFFLHLAEGRKDQTVRRYARVRLRLYDFLDVDDMIQWLGPDDATLLAAEREFVRDGAVWSTFGLDGVLRCLPGFLAESQLPTSKAEAHMQVSVIGRFVTWVRDWHRPPTTTHERESLRTAWRAVRQAKRHLEERERSPELQAVIDEIDRRQAQFRQERGLQ